MSGRVTGSGCAGSGPAAVPPVVPALRWGAAPPPEALRHLAANVGSSQIMLGTDYPYPWEDKAVEHIMNTPSLSDDERIAILGTTAAKLLRIAD